MAAALVAAGAAVVPSLASAHSPVDGIEGFYIGMAHPLSTADQLLALLGLGLMLGLRGRSRVGRALAVFAVAMLAGVVWGQMSGSPPWTETVLLLAGTTAATLAALRPGGIGAACLLLAGLVGALIGVLSTPEIGSVRATVFTVAGSIVGGNIALLYLSLGIGWLREKYGQPWVRIALRVVAAWLGAVSIMMVALTAAQR